MSLEEIRKKRLEKIERLKKAGQNPYPAKSERDTKIIDFLDDFDSNLKSNKKVTVAGRIMSIRSHGASTFFDIYDGTGRIQAFLKKDEVDSKSYDLFIDVVDMGDFVEIGGQAFKTKKEEESILVSSWKMISKSLRPIPEEWFGLEDEEKRMRQRYLDLLLNKETKDIFYKKDKFWEVIRKFLKERNFLEVETPTLEVTTGGAEARPFKTYHRDFDMDVYLRVSVGELWQKRLMAAGFPRTYEIGRAYRNEGSSSEHVQEFTNMEFYAAFMNFEEGQDLVRDLYIKIAEEVFGTTKFETRGHSFDLSGKWKEIDYVKTVEEITGINVLEASEKEMEEKLKELKVSYEGQNRERMIDSLWKYCRKKISGPAYLVNHPKLVAPLSKEHPDNPKLTKTFQVILAGSEVGRAHTELNDPRDQLERFKIQEELRKEGDEEAMMADMDYVEMLEYGMPPTFGFGVGERLFAFLADKSIREVQLFPLVKPK